MPCLLSNSRYFVIVLLSLLFLGGGTLFLSEGKVETSEKIESKPKPQPAEELQVNQPPLIFINSLPVFRLALRRQMQPIFDIGNNTKSMHAELDYIESLTGILVTLANYYSPKQFGNLTPQEFISEIIKSRFRWNDAVVEPLGPATGGKLALLFSASGVASDVENMIEEMVLHLDLVSYWEDNFDYNEWKKAWRNSDF